MSDWATIENDAVAALAALEDEGEAVFASVASRTPRDRKLLAGAIQRELLPAAYVFASERESSDRATGRPGGVWLGVMLAMRSLRSDGEARVGAAGDGGMWSLAESVARELQDKVLSETWRLALAEERFAGGEDGTVVWEQCYQVCRPAEWTAPTFGGVALAGTSSEVQVELGELRRASSLFSFPGIDGVFERYLGVRERPIFWRGRLAAADDEALNALEATIEDEIHSGQEKAVADAWGRSHAGCVLRRFERRGARRRDELTGAVWQEFELEFAQLGR